MSKIDYVTILEGAFDAGMLVNADNGTILYANEMCQQLLGLESSSPWMCSLDSKLTWWNYNTPPQTTTTIPTDTPTDTDTEQLQQQLLQQQQHTKPDMLEWDSILPLLQRHEPGLPLHWNITAHAWDHHHFDEAPDQDENRQNFPAVAKPTLVHDRNNPGHFFAVIFIRHQDAHHIMSHQHEHHHNQQQQQQQQQQRQNSSLHLTGDDDDESAATPTASTTPRKRRMVIDSINACANCGATAAAAGGSSLLGNSFSGNISTSLPSGSSFFRRPRSDSVNTTNIITHCQDEPSLTVDRKGMILSVSASAIEQIDWCQPELVGKSVRPIVEKEQPKPILSLNPEGTIIGINELAASEYTWLNTTMIGQNVMSIAPMKDDSNKTGNTSSERESHADLSDNQITPVVKFEANGTCDLVSFEAERQHLMMDLWDTPAKWKQVEIEIQREEWEKEKKRQLAKQQNALSEKRTNSWFSRAWRSNTSINTVNGSIGKRKSDGSNRSSIIPHLSIADDSVSSDVVLQVCIVERDGETMSSAAADAHQRESVMMTIVEAALDPLFQINSSGVIQIANKAACTTFGYQREELVGQNIAIVCGGGHEQHHARYLQRYLATGDTRVIGRKRELRGRKKDGVEFPIELAVVEVDTFLGEERLFCGFIRDLTDIQTSQKLNRSIAEASLDPMFLIDEKGMIQMVNQAAVDLFGHTRSTLLESNISIIVGGEHAGDHDSYLRAYMETGKTNITNQRRELMARRHNNNTGMVSEFPIELTVVEIPVTHEGQKRIFCGFVRDLSQIKEQQQQLQERERLVTGILNSSIDPLFQINQNGIIETVNLAACQVFQYEESEFLGKNISIIVGKKHRENHDLYLKRYLKTGIKRVMGKARELEARRKDGTEFIIELSLAEIETDDDSKNRLFCGFVRDLSRRKLQEHAILKRQRLMESMFKASLDPLFQINSSGIIQNVNQAACKLFQYSEKDLMGSNISMIVGSQHSASHDDYLQRYLKTGIKRVMGKSRELWAKKKDGTEVLVELSLTEVETDDDDERLFCGFIHDLTRRKRNERAVRRKERLATGILNASIEPLFQMNEMGIIEIVNKVACRVFYYEERELVGQNLSNLVDSRDLSKYDNYFEQFLQSSLVHVAGKPQELLARRKDGVGIHIELSLAEIETNDDEERLFSGFVRDLTEVKNNAKKDKAVVRKCKRFISEIIKGSRDPLFELNGEGIIQKANAAMCNFLGHTMEEYIGQHISLFVETVHSGYAQFWDQFSLQNEGGARPMAEDDQPTIIARHKSGKQLQVELSIADLAPPSECDGANGWQIICFVHDVEQKQQLRHGGFDLSNSLVLDQLHDALFVTNGRGKILWVNTTAVKMFAKRGQCEKSVVQKEQFCQQDSLYQLLCREDAELLEIDVKKFFLYNTEILRVRKVQAIRLDDSSFESTMVVSVLDQVKGTLCVFFRQDPDQLVTQTATIDTPPEKLNSGVNVVDNEIGFSSLTRGRKLDPPSHESITGDGIEMGDSVDDEDDDDSHPDGLADVVYMDNHLVKHPSEQGENNQGNFSLNDRHSDNDDESESSDDEEDSILDDDFEFEDTILTYP